jgi:hypothetical protein
VEYRSEKGGFEETTMVSTRDAAREVAAQARREDPSAFVRIIRVSTTRRRWRVGDHRCETWYLPGPGVWQWCARGSQGFCDTFSEAVMRAEKELEAS